MIAAHHTSVFILVELVCANIFPNIEHDACAIAFSNPTTQLSQIWRQSESLRTLISVQIDSNVDILVTLALKV